MPMRHVWEMTTIGNYDSGVVLKVLVAPVALP